MTTKIKFAPTLIKINCNKSIKRKFWLFCKKLNFYVVSLGMRIK
jgi:hypothetical protein